MKLLFIAIVVLIPACTLILVAVLRGCAQRIIEAIKTIPPFVPAQKSNPSVTGRLPPSLEEINQARERANFKTEKELPQGCPENNGGDCTEDCGPGMPHCKKRQRKILRGEYP